jgi:hypothetical protein
VSRDGAGFRSSLSGLNMAVRVDSDHHLIKKPEYPIEITPVCVRRHSDQKSLRAPDSSSLKFGEPRT